ncbi:hypothetical protein DMB65_20770 [Flavobacterium cheongpyeongense]|uniref:Uncharacterized protein n=1 Tax=Flavobacterium cheongpyeongense TaxID=2212651 RepID=A0A2V4BIY2_9FLAO|nr:hypothetical protein [Flavobacterium cheongpyeongense]PXY38895.1 hypothetical protein DMB65_20770 [Flavobacterium cheongpyeongense]
MKNLKFGHYYLLFLIVLFGFLHIRGVRIQNNIKKNGKDIVVKFVKKKSYPKTTDFYFSYYINDSLYTTTGSGIKYDIFNSEKETQAINDLKIGVYYLARFNQKYPNIIIVNPNKRIVDTLEIEKFGFNMKEEKKNWQKELFSETK